MLGPAYHYAPFFAVTGDNDATSEVTTSVINSSFEVTYLGIFRRFIRPFGQQVIQHQDLSDPIDQLKKTEQEPFNEY